MELQINEPILIRPHHVNIVLAGIHPSFASSHHLNSLASYFRENKPLLYQVLEYISQHLDSPIKIASEPDEICRVCPDYDFKQNACTRYYDDEDHSKSAEELRVIVDQESALVQDLKKLKTVRDILQKRHLEKQLQ